MRHGILILLCLSVLSACRSWTDDVEEKPEPPDDLFEIPELVLEASACDTIVKLTGLIDYPHCFFRSVCDDGYNGIDSTTVVYEFGDNCDTVRSEWFSVIRYANELLVSVQPNASVSSRQFRILYMAIPTSCAFIVTQQGTTTLPPPFTARHPKGVARK